METYSAGDEVNAPCGAPAATTAAQGGSRCRRGTAAVTTAAGLGSSSTASMADDRDLVRLDAIEAAD